MHEWMLDNRLTPHLVVDASRDGVTAPEVPVTEGRIVFNLSSSATRALVLGNDLISFEARFGGVSRGISIPVGAVLGIYARETGQGMIFGDDDDSPRDPSAAVDTPRRPTLKVVK